MTADEAADHTRRYLRSFRAPDPDGNLTPSGLPQDGTPRRLRMSVTSADGGAHEWGATAWLFDDGAVAVADIAFA